MLKMKTAIACIREKTKQGEWLYPELYKTVLPVNNPFGLLGYRLYGHPFSETKTSFAGLSRATRPKNS
jgi:hypothetical protein